MSADDENIYEMNNTPDDNEDFFKIKKNSDDSDSLEIIPSSLEKEPLKDAELPEDDALPEDAPMDPRKKLVIIAMAILWGIFLTWGVVKTFTTSKQTKLAEMLKAGQPQEQQQQIIPPVLVRAFSVKKVNFDDMLPAMGAVKAKSEIPLKFEISGILQEINFKEGEKVKNGDLIARINPKDYDLRLEYSKNKLLSAESTLKSAQKKLSVFQKLYEAGAIIQEKLEEIELDVETKKADYEAIRSERRLAEEELLKTYLYASTDGFMGPRESEEGESISPTDAIGSLLDVSKVFVEIGIVEKDINKINADQKANIWVDAYNYKLFTGFIERIYPLVEGKSRTLTARIQVENPQNLLIPGMFARVEVFIISLKNSLIVPAASLIDAGNETFFLPVIPKDSTEEEEEQTLLGTMKLSEVKIGYMSSDYVEIKSGIKEDDYVITEAQGELDDGIQVRIIGLEEINF